MLFVLSQSMNTNLNGFRRYLEYITAWRLSGMTTLCKSTCHNLGGRGKHVTSRFGILFARHATPILTSHDQYVI